MKSQVFTPSSLANIFSSDMRNIAKNLSKSSERKQKQCIPPVINTQYKCNIERVSFDCMEGLEMEKYYLYAFAKNKEYNSQISLYLYRKSNGSKQHLSVKSFNGYITSMNFLLFKVDHQTNTDKNTSLSYYKLAIGFSDGCIKFLDLHNNYKLESMRCDVKMIKMIIEGDHAYFHNHNVCFVLTTDSFVYVIDISKLKVTFVLRPNIVTCQRALSISINQQYTYLMQVTQGGYIIFWKMSDILNNFKAISIQQKQKEIQKLYNVLPLKINHTLTIENVIWCSFYGNLIAFVDKKGFFKLFVLNMQVDNQFINLLQFRIENHQCISYAKLFSLQNALFIAKSTEGGCFVQKLFISELLNISKVLRISVEKMDVINEFQITQGCPIIMCRGNKYIGIGFCTELFDKKVQDKNNEEEICQKQY